MIHDARFRINECRIQSADCGIEEDGKLAEALCEGWDGIRGTKLQDIICPDRYLS